MKAIEKLHRQIESVGGKLDAGPYTLNCDAPSGYVWSANGCCCYAIHYATNSETWLTKAIKSEMPALKMGLDKVTDPDEIAEKRWTLGDDSWGAPESAPNRIDFPK